MANLTVPDELIGITYMVRHNPNCPMPYEVRLTGVGLLQEHYGSAFRHKHRDDVGYGNSLWDAAAAALLARKEREAAPGRKQAAKMFRDLWAGL